MMLACTIEKLVGAYANRHQFASTSIVLPVPFPRTTAASPLGNNTRNQLHACEWSVAGDNEVAEWD